MSDTNDILDSLFSRKTWLELEGFDELCVDVQGAIIEIVRLRAEVAALRAQADPLAEMWRELEAYQPFANRDGHGESWRVMCEERTEEAAWSAALMVRSLPQTARAYSAARAASMASHSLVSAKVWAADVIVPIRKAKEETA